MDDLIKDYFLLDEAQQKCIFAAIGQSHEYCLRASQLMKVADDLNTQSAIVSQIDFSDSSHSYVTLELRFYCLNFDMKKYLAIFKTFSTQHTQNIAYSFASAALDLTYEDFDQFESIIKPIFANFDRMHAMYLRDGKPPDTAFTTAKNFLEKKPAEKEL